MAAPREPDPEPETGQWRAAGVLPYAVLDGTVLCMLGKEYALAPSTTRLLVQPRAREHPPDTGDPATSASAGSAKEPQYRCWWSDFGGGREAEDASVVHTAAREWAEETVGVYGDGSNLVSRVENSAKAMLAQLCETGVAPDSSAASEVGPTFAVVGETYTMYACAVPFVDTLIFQLARDENDAEATAAAVRTTQSGAVGSNKADDEALRKLRRRCGEKRDFAWVPLQSVLAAVGSGRTWLRDVDGQMITLLPRLGYALQTSGPTLLRAISEVLFGSGSVSPSLRQRDPTVLSVPPRHAGGCSLYLSVRRRRLITAPQEVGGSTGSEGADKFELNGPAVVDEVDVAAALLHDTVKLLPRFGDVRRAVLHRYPSPPADVGAEAERRSGLRDPFVLVTFFCSTAASEARRWLNSSGSASKPRAAGLQAVPYTEVVAEFAFFEPKKRRRSSAAGFDSNSDMAAGAVCAGAAGPGSHMQKKTRPAGGWGHGGAFLAQYRGGAGRKTKLGVRPSRNAAVAAADGPAELHAKGAATASNVDPTPITSASTVVALS